MDVVTVDRAGTLGRRTVATAASVANVRTSMGHLALNAHAQFARVESRVASLEGQVAQVFDLATTIDRDARRGIASIASQANPHFPSGSGRTSYAGNVATYRGEWGRVARPDASAGRRRPR